MAQLTYVIVRRGRMFYAGKNKLGTHWVSEYLNALVFSDWKEATGYSR
jgi:hypothetical protein